MFSLPCFSHFPAKITANLSILSVMGNECDFCERVEDGSNRRNQLASNFKDHRPQQPIPYGKENQPPP
jgi:hypothetical protein